MRLKNYVHGEWVEGTGKTTALYNAVTGEQVGEASTGGWISPACWTTRARSGARSFAA